MVNVSNIKMKLFIVGSDKVYAIENLYVKYLCESGLDVYHFSAQSLFYDYYQKSVLNKIIYKCGLSGIIKKINELFKVAVSSYQPDIIWVFKGMEISPESLQWAKDKNIKLVNYNPDNPFIFSGKGSGNDYLKNSISLYDLHLTYNSEVKKEMESVYKIPTGILPFGFDVRQELLETCVDTANINKLCFLGNPDKFRAGFLTELAEQGIELDIYGNNWNKFVSHKNITVFNPVLGDDFWINLYKYNIQLNLMRPHNPDTHNMRSFEIPGVGGIQLAPATPDHGTYFIPGEEIFLYNDLLDCVLQINKILALPQIEKKRIRVQSRNRSVASGYSYKDRSDQALQYITALYD